MTDEITVCPECESSQIRTRNINSMHGPESTKRWHCEDCRIDFDTPDTRPRKPSGGVNGLAHTLSTLSPDQVGGRQ